VTTCRDNGCAEVRAPRATFSGGVPSAALGTSSTPPFHTSECVRTAMSTLKDEEQIPRTDPRRIGLGMTDFSEETRWNWE